MELLSYIGLGALLYQSVYAFLPWFLDSDICLAFYEKFGKRISSLRGKVVWITGASSGIGEQLAYVLAKAGCKLILSARRHEELERVKDNCLAEFKHVQESDIEIQSFDICDLTIQEAVFKGILKKFGTLDILVSNAGRSQRAEWELIDLRVDKEMFELNVFSHVSLCRLVGNYFLKAGQGHFVITSSVAGIRAVPFSATYCATKYALHGYFDTFCIEKANTNIAVTLVCPGPIQTNFLAECFTDKPGEKYGVNTEVAKNKVSAQRCAKLMGVAIANKLTEVWIAKPLVIQMLYFAKKFPNLASILSKKLGTSVLQHMRDSKTTVTVQSQQIEIAP